VQEAYGVGDAGHGNDYGRAAFCRRWWRKKGVRWGGSFRRPRHSQWGRARDIEEGKTNISMAAHTINHRGPAEGSEAEEGAGFTAGSVRRRVRTPPRSERRKGGATTTTPDSPGGCRWGRRARRKPSPEPLTRLVLHAVEDPHHAAGESIPP